MDDAGYYGQNRKEMLAFLPAKAVSILDVGCGAGGFAKTLKAHHHNLHITGIEYDANAASKAKEHLDEVHQGDAEQLLKDLPKNSFDVIFFNDVLEHMHQPEKVLLSSKHLLKNDGKIIASLPNVRYIKNLYHVLIQKDWHYEDHGILDRTHLRFYTKKSALRMFEELGFRVESCTGINPTSWKIFDLINLLTFGQLSDARYMQYVVVATLEMKCYC